MHTNDEGLNNASHHESKVLDAEHPGYETTDVNVGGVAVFLAGLFGFVLIFFGFCFVMGRVINSAYESADGKAVNARTSLATRRYNRSSCRP
jgi:hypothetical protein